MYIFFDTEFTGLQKDTDLISIGLVSWDGQIFYAEFTDYREELCDGWIKNNVISNLVMNDPAREAAMFGDNKQHYYKGTRKEIAQKLADWLSGFGEMITLVSDVCHYDMVLLLDLFGGGLNLPKHINPTCYDISYDITEYIKRHKNLKDIPVWDIRNNHAEWEAFDTNREELINDLLNNMGLDDCNIYNMFPVMKHNSLYDARVIRILFSLLHIASKMDK